MINLKWESKRTNQPHQRKCFDPILVIIGWKFWYGGCTICYRFFHVVWWHIICKRWDWNSAHSHLIAKFIFLERDNVILLWNNSPRVPYWNLAFFYHRLKSFVLTLLYKPQIQRSTPWVSSSPSSTSKKEDWQQNLWVCFMIHATCCS